jgi:hypothetical protein
MDALKNHEAGWDEALIRLLTYFEAMDLGGIEHRTRCALEIVNEARADSSAHASPVERCMDRAAQKLGEWFGEALGSSTGPTSNKLTAGLLAWKVTGGSEFWGDIILSAPPPQALRQAFSGVRAQTGPDLSISSMTSREMDYGPMENLAQETWHRFAWAPLLRAVILWTAIFFAALAIDDHFFLK